jgi:hypothetical protein
MANSLDLTVTSVSGKNKSIRRLGKQKYPHTKKYTLSQKQTK